MTFLDVVVVALIQGAAETLPLDAASHLFLLFPAGLPAHELAAVLAASHVGLAAGLAAYLWRDMAAMAVGVARLTKGKVDSGGRLLLNLAVGTLPAVAAGGAMLLAGGAGWTGAIMAAAALLCFGFLLLAADRLGVTVRRVEHMGWAAAAAIGAVQAMALIPGISRTGVTVTAARLMGYERREAARFSLILAIPLSLVQGLFIALALGGEVDLVVSADLALAAAIAALASLVFAALLMTWLGRRGFIPFALWQMGLGAVLLAQAL